MFDPKVHEYSTSFRGDAAAAFDLARSALLSQGFEILKETDSEFCTEGPGMHSNHQSPLVGVSVFRLNVSATAITATATLGGIAKMAAFIYLFPPGLVISLVVGMMLAGHDMSWGVLLAAAPWLFLSPWMASSMERKTRNSVDGLVRGMAQMKAGRGKPVRQA